MLSVVSYIIYALIVLIAIILVVLILIQPSKGGGFGSAFGGVGENVFGAHAMEHISKLTVWLITIFFILALAQTVISGKLKVSDKSLMSEAKAAEPAKKVDEAKAAPEAKAAEPAKKADEVKASPAVNAEPAKKADEVKASPAVKAEPAKKAETPSAK